MNCSWMPEAEILACHWSEVGRPSDYDPSRMLENSEGHGAWLPPVPDFASHSPFGVPPGFKRTCNDPDSHTWLERA